MSTPSRSEVLANPAREVFIFVLSVLSIVNFVLMLPFSPLTPAQRQVIIIIDAVLTLFFLVDFFVRLHAAGSRRGYFFHERGWLDLLGSLPYLRLLRIFRMVRAWTLMRQYGLRAMMGWLWRDRAESALYLITVLVILVLEVAGTAVLPFEEGAPGANITSGGDALWWGLVTVTTVGYGDEYPVTEGGRAVGVFLLLTGVVLFATLSGFLANAFLSPSRSEVEAREASAASPASTAGDDGAAMQEILALLRQQQRETAELRARLEDVARSGTGGATPRMGE